MLRGRQTELGRLEELLAAAGAGRSGAIVLRGEAGIGKTALLRHVASSGGARVLQRRGRGVGDGAAVRRAAPALRAAARRPRAAARRRSARRLRTAFGLSAGAAPDRFLRRPGRADAAVRGAAETRRSSASSTTRSGSTERRRRCSSFVARRLRGRVGRLVVRRARHGRPTSCRAAELRSSGSRDARRARAAAATVMRGPLDEQVRERIIAETRGNPLALLELPRGLVTRELAGGFGAARRGAAVRADRGELPAAASRQLPAEHAAAAAARGRRAGRRPGAAVARCGRGSGIGAAAAAPAEAAGLVEIGARVTFRHPLRALGDLPRGAARASAGAAHGALADGHRPRARSRPARLASRPGRARARRGRRRRARALGRARAGARRAGGGRRVPRARRGADARPGRRAQRALGGRAGASSWRARPRRRCGCSTIARGGAARRARSARRAGAAARADRVRRSRRGRDARAAAAATPHGGSSRSIRALARETYLEALPARRSPAGSAQRVRELAEARAAGAGAGGPAPPRAGDLLLDGLALLLTDGPRGRRAAAQAGARARSRDERVGRRGRSRWLVASRVASRRPVATTRRGTCSRRATSQLAREAGALARAAARARRCSPRCALSPATSRGARRWSTRRTPIAEATGSRPRDAARLLLAACRGDEAEARALIDASDRRRAARAARARR